MMMKTMNLYLLCFLQQSPRLSPSPSPSPRPRRNPILRQTRNARRKQTMMMTTASTLIAITIQANRTFIVLITMILKNLMSKFQWISMKQIGMQPSSLFQDVSIYILIIYATLSSLIPYWMKMLFNIMLFVPTFCIAIINT